MITEDTLTGWLTTVADAQPLPSDGQARALDCLKPDRETGAGRARPAGAGRHGMPRPSARHVAVAAGLVGLIIVSASTGVAAARHGRQHGVAKSASTAGQVFDSPDAGAPDVQGATTAVAGAAGTTGSSGTTAQSEPGVTSGAVALPAGPAASGETMSGTVSATVAVGAGPGGTVAAPRIVRTATVQLQVAAQDAGRTLTRLSALATADGGYVQESTSSLAGAVPTGSETLRIPSADYAKVRDALAGGGYGTVQSLQEQGQDVTAQYTDLGARLNALAATRASYLTLLGRASSIPDVLAVQAQLSAVQVQIESLQGQLKVLADTSDDASITVTVTGPPAPVHHHRSGWSLALDRAGHGVVHDLQAILARSGSVLVGVVVVLGAVSVLAVAALVGTRLVRRRLI